MINEGIIEEFKVKKQQLEYYDSLRTEEEKNKFRITNTPAQIQSNIIFKPPTITAQEYLLNNVFIKYFIVIEGVIDTTL